MPVTRTAPAGTASATRTAVAAAASSTKLVSADGDRYGFSVRNNSSNILWLEYGAAATTASAVQLVAGAYFEDPWAWVGEVYGIWDGTNGEAEVMVVK